MLAAQAQAERCWFHRDGRYNTILDRIDSAPRCAFFGTRRNVIKEAAQGGSGRK
jgi:hypothetical protein